MIYTIAVLTTAYSVDSSLLIMAQKYTTNGLFPHYVAPAMPCHIIAVPCHAPFSRLNTVSHPPPVPCMTHHTYCTCMYSGPTFRTKTGYCTTTVLNNKDIIGNHANPQCVSFQGSYKMKIIFYYPPLRSLLLLAFVIPLPHSIEDVLVNRPFSNKIPFHVVCPPPEQNQTV